jgi:hypothetical protein
MSTIEQPARPSGLEDNASSRRGRRLRRAAGGALVAVLSVAGPVALSDSAAAATSVAPGAVTVMSADAGASGVLYTVPFTTSGSGALGAGATITIVAPDDTTLSSTASDYGIMVNNGHAGIVGSVAVSKVAGPGSSTASTTNNKVVITLSASDIAAGDTVTVGLGNTTNPTAASNSYQLSEATSSDTTAALSPDYSITAAPATTMNYIAGDNQSTQVDTAFPTKFQVQVFDQFGNPVPNWNVDFAGPSTGPSGTFASCASNPHTYQCDVVTDANGFATASVFTANGETGSYQAGAFTSGAQGATSPSPVYFNLTNTAASGPPPPPPPAATPLPVIATQGGGNALWVYWETQDAQWHGPLGVGAAGWADSVPAVALGLDDLPAVAVQGPGNSLDVYWETQDAQWHGPYGVAGPGTTFSAPSITMSPNGLPTIAAEGPGGALYIYWETQDAQWHGPYGVAGPGTTFSAPSIASASNGLPTIAAEGPGGALYIYWQTIDAQWHGPYGVGGPGTTNSAPSIATGSNDLPTIDTQGPGDSTYVFWESADAQWHGPLGVGGAGSSTAPPSVTLGQNDLPTVATGGPGGSLWVFWESIDAQWHGPYGVDNAAGTVGPGGPAASSGPDGLPVCADQGPGDSLWVFWESIDAQWHGPYGVGNPSVSNSTPGIDG